MDIFAGNQVIIAGAGPGDPELITLQVKRACEEAQVVLVDRLVHPEIIKRFVSESAKVVSVGKAYNDPESVSQSRICQDLLKFAQSGLRTLRLKGGDVSLFSNVYDEILILREHQIQFRLLAGISAMSGVAACMGIPLTARLHSSQVEILMYGYEAKTEADCLNLARRMVSDSNTRVLFMSSARLPQMLGHLLIALAEKRAKNTPYWLAIIERATTPMQRIRLFDLASEASVNALRSSISSVNRPALLMTGKVLEIYEYEKGGDTVAKP